MEYADGGTLSERLHTIYPAIVANEIRLTLLMFVRAGPSTYLGLSTTARDGAAHVFAGALAGIVVRPLGWAACGCSPTSRGRPDRVQTPWQKAQRQ